ncbi:MAG: RNA-binding cell elongation regulator Jag/EloR [Acidimicrobiales bacterium]
MEWVEISGSTLEEAKELALEQLGVAETDAELIVLAEPKVGLFGRTRGEARVRARVQPVGPRPKRQRRPRRAGGSNGNGSRRKPSSETQESARAAELREPKPTEAGGSGSSRSRSRSRSRSSGGQSEGRPAKQDRSGERAESSRGRQEKEADMAEGVTLEEQAEAAKEFMEGLLEAFGYAAAIETRVLDEDTLEVAANGDELGLLVGPRGSTLAALQDVTRTVVQHRFPTRTDRIVVDVAGYRQRRVAALQRFTQQVAEEVLEAKAERSLEPMSPADRKVVHDTINEIEGLVTRSEGEDAARHVVIAPTD